MIQVGKGEKDKAMKDLETEIAEAAKNYEHANNDIKKAAADLDKLKKRLAENPVKDQSLPEVKETILEIRRIGEVLG